MKLVLNELFHIIVGDQINQISHMNGYQTSVPEYFIVLSMLSNSYLIYVH